MQMPLLALGAALSILAAAPASASESPTTSACPSWERTLSSDPFGRAEVARAFDEIVGHAAPEWSFERWIRTAPLSLDALRGKVVLLRWWTDKCHYCAATLPALEELRQRHARDGLVVIGVYHPKPPRTMSDRTITSVANKLGFSGPIAVDLDWSTLERYWLDGHPERTWTSVSFLIDRDGVIRWFHGGGEYHPSMDKVFLRDQCVIQRPLDLGHIPCDASYRGLERVLVETLAEPAAARLP